MAKKVTKVVKIQIPAGKATPAPPVGTIFGPLGINLQEFCTRYNDATRDKMGDIIPCEVSVYDDRSFDFVLKTPPAASLLLKVAGVQKGGVKGANDIVATITKDQLKQVAEIKLPDLNTNDIEQAMKIVAGTARNMGIAVKGLNDVELEEQAEEAKEAEAEMAKLDAEFAEMEAEAKANADAEVPEVESTEQKAESVEE
ncbi:MAG TPA: 50S ribosomal protein L11 [Firmicutes bacterium]|nr:50S ribosomal protein L11 [Bacillota bacterium]